MKTQTKPSHTPTPWFITTPHGDRSYYGIAAKRPDKPQYKFEVAAVYKAERASQDAAFIVNAVNAYERDQQIKEELLTFVKNIRPFLGNDPEATLHKQADNLIAKAEGK